MSGSQILGNRMINMSIRPPRAMGLKGDAKFTSAKTRIRKRSKRNMGLGIRVSIQANVPRRVNPPAVPAQT
jgi:hypothetical protein